MKDENERDDKSSEESESNQNIDSNGNENSQEEEANINENADNVNPSATDENTKKKYYNLVSYFVYFHLFNFRNKNLEKNPN